MIFKETEVEGVIEVVPTMFEDARGFFFETYRADKFKEAGIEENFMQANQSFSTKNVLRGLHFQAAPHGQAKLVRVITGKVLDVAVDMRKNSPTFGKHVKRVLDSNTGNMLFIPGDFAHGFLALEDTILQYNCSNLYNKASEKGVIWNDATINIDWGIENPIISEKDLILPTFEAFAETL